MSAPIKRTFEERQLDEALHGLAHLHEGTVCALKQNSPEMVAAVLRIKAACIERSMRRAGMWDQAQHEQLVGEMANAPSAFVPPGEIH